MVAGRSTRSLDRTKVAICPHCKANTIGVHAKAWSSAASPTRCRGCGGFSYISNPHGTAASRAVILVPALALVILFTTGSLWWSLAAVGVLVVGGVAYEAVAFYRTPMVAIAHEEIPAARHWERVGLVILGVGAVAVVLLLWGSRAV